MATSKDNNNWGGMSPSKAKLTAPKSIASTLKSKTAASTAKAKATTSKTTTSKAVTPKIGIGLSGTGNFSTVDPGGASAANAAARKNYLTTYAFPTPANAGIVKPSVGVPFYLAKPTATTPKPSQVVSGTRTGTTSGGTGAQAKSIYDYLNVDPTAIYQPLVDLVQEQRDAANARYAANLGDIKNIFSALTGIGPADKARINDQFKNMLTAQQTALATRTAAATAQGNAGAEQAVSTGAESGGGDAMVLNPLQTATAEGIGQSNAIASIWEGLQGANQAQALADVDARQAGYTAQQLAATQGLQQSLADRLLGIAGTEADIQSQLAQQKFGIAQDIGQAKYSNALAQQQAAARAAAAANTPAKLTALEKVRASLEPGQFDAIAAQLNSAYARAYAGANPATYTGAGKEPSVAAVMAEWATKGNKNLISQARTIAETIYGR